jgi:hypothetical protein
VADADLGVQAVTERLQRMSALSAERGFIVKGPAMDAESVTARLRLMSSLADMCFRLAEVGRASGALRSEAGGVKRAGPP